MLPLDSTTKKTYQVFAVINELEGEQPDELRLEDAVHGSGGHRPHDDVIGLELGNELGQNLVLLLLGRREHDLENEARILLGWLSWQSA